MDDSSLKGVSHAEFTKRRQEFFDGLVGLIGQRVHVTWSTWSATDTCVLKTVNFEKGNAEIAWIDKGGERQLSTTDLLHIEAGPLPKVTKAGKKVLTVEELQAEIKGGKSK